MSAEELAARGGGSSSLPLLAGIALVIALVALALRFVQKSDRVSRVMTESKKGAGAGASDKKKPLDGKVQLDPQADGAYILNCLRPSSTPLEILYAMASSPDSVKICSRQIAMAADLREKKVAHLKEKEKEASHKSMEDLLSNDDGWAEEDEDDPAAKAAKKAKEEKEREAKRLAKATGKDAADFTKMKFEGIDDGVLGQKWVVSNLENLGAWPPPDLDDTVLGSKKFGLDGKVVSAIDHPAVARNLVMTMGRLHSRHLNTRPDLVAAGPKGLIDPTYFQDSIMYRQRVNQMLDNALRAACQVRSHRLAEAVLDAMIMFKAGVTELSDESSLSAFKEMMTRQYGPNGCPRLIVDERYLGVPTPDVPPLPKDMPEAERKKEMEKNRIARQVMQTKQVTADDERMALEMQITRGHAEGFTRAMVAKCQAQGIPPQIGFSTHRESWFILVRARKVGEDGKEAKGWNCALGAEVRGTNYMDLLKGRDDGICGMLEPSTFKRFRDEYEDPDHLSERKMVIGWPFVVQNVAQKTGKVKIHLPPPAEPGRYEFLVKIRSQDWLVEDEEFELTVDVAKGSGKKKKKEEKEDEEEEDDDEGKKDK